MGSHLTDQEQNNSVKDVVQPENMGLLIAEYNALREEILKGSEVQYQLIALTLTAFGLILTVGLQAKNVSILLVYPILALFLATVWTNTQARNAGIGAYIRKNIEPRAAEKAIGWESYLHQTWTWREFRGITSAGSSAIFIITELLAIFVGLSVANFNLNATEKILLTLDVLSTLLSVILFILVSLISFRKRG
jgi:hypothetical protein